MCEISCVLPFNSKNFLKIIAGKIQINLHKLHFLKFWFWESSNETQRTCFWVIFDLLNYGCCSVAHSCPVLCDPPWTAAHRPFLSFTISWSLLKCMSIEPVMPSNHLILCHALLLLPSIFPSIRVFSNGSDLGIRWPKHSASVLLKMRILKLNSWASVQCSSVAQSCPTLCDPMNRSTPGLPVHHQLPEFTQTRGS